MIVLFTRDRAAAGARIVRPLPAASGGHVPDDPAQRLYRACNPSSADAAAQLQPHRPRAATHRVDRATFAYRSYCNCPHCPNVNALTSSRCDGCGAEKPSREDRR